MLARTIWDEDASPGRTGGGLREEGSAFRRRRQTREKGDLPYERGHEMKEQHIPELQKRRADNLIWTSAEDYSFTPDFKAYDPSGRAEIYWNILFGAARRHYAYEKLEELFAMLDKYRDAALYESLFWNALEPVLFQKELAFRPVLERLRPAPVETELRFDEEMTTEEIVERAREFFYERYGLYGDGKIRLRFRLPRLRRMSVDSFLQRGTVFFRGDHQYHGNVTGWNGDFVQSNKMNASELRAFLETKFGKSIYSPRQEAQMEKLLCTGNHRFTHLLFTKGEIGELHGIYSTFEMHQRKRQEELVAENRAYYRRHLAQNRVQIEKLSTRIMNSLLLHMQQAPVKARTGRLNQALAWRGAMLNDGRIFTRTENGNAGDMSVDLLLDASHSQSERARKIASQAAIISQALARCGVPCRVMSFCSMSGFTVLRLFRDYEERSSGDSIFDYYPEGCNRDGLAVRAAGHLMREAPYEHKMLIVLSDVKPLDPAARIRRDERDLGESYDAVRALRDTAFEVRRLRAEGISVLCVFTGEDENLPAARMVYGQDFVRIRDFSNFADAVGELILDQIKLYTQ